jgi:hypothetical protein
MSRSADEIFNLEDQFHALVPAKTGYVAINKQGKDFYLQEQQAFVRPRHPKRIEFAPQSTSTVQFGSGLVVTEFKITEQSDFEQIEHLSIRGTIRKLATASPNPDTDELASPSPLWINKIEIFTGGTTRAIQTYYGDQLWTAFQCLAKEQMEAFRGGNLLYMDTNFKADNSTPYLNSASPLVGNSWSSCQTNGTTYTRAFVIPLLGLVTEKFRLRALSGDTIIRVTWEGNQIGRAQNGTVATQAASGKFALNQISLLLESEEVMKQDKDAYTALLKSSELYVKYLEPIEQRYGSISLQPSVSTPLQLTSVDGEVALLQVIVRSSNRLLTDLVTLAPGVANAGLQYNGQDTSLDGTIQLEHSNGQVILSQTPMKLFEMRYMHGAKHFMNTMANDIAIYQMSMSETPAVAILKGQVDGYVDFKATEYLKIVPSPQFIAQTVDIKVVAWRVQHLCLKDRKADVIR